MENSTASSLKLNYASDKSGGSEESDVDSLCLSDAGLAALGECFPKLEKVNLIWCSNVTNDGLISLARKCTTLKALDLQVLLLL